MEQNYSKIYLKEMECQLDAAFKSQDPQLLGIAFEIDGKKLYADKLRLSLNSSIFKSMLSDSWNKIIEIKDFSFADFNEFLTFIHSGKCNITNQNIFVMVDIAEFYQSEHFKSFCNEYLSKMAFDLTNIFQLLNIYNKYSMDLLKTPIHDYIIKNFDSFVESEGFMNAGRFVIKEVVTLESNTFVKPEDVFRAVFQWAENRTKSKANQLSNAQNFDMNDAIKAEITEFLPFIEFKKMTLHFVINFVVKRGFIFSYEELSEILNSVQSDVRVKITNNLGQSLYGYLPNGSDAIEIIKSSKDSKSHVLIDSIVWKPKCKIPLNPSSLEKRGGVKWYLVFWHEFITLKCCRLIEDTDYLIAEMFPETDFVITPECKIEIE